MRGCGGSTSVRLNEAESVGVRGAQSSLQSHQALPCLPGARPPPFSASASRKRPHLRGSPLGREQRVGPGGRRGTECERPQLGSVTHWHYWCGEAVKVAPSPAPPQRHGAWRSPCGMGSLMRWERPGPRSGHRESWVHCSRAE